MQSSTLLLLAAHGAIPRFDYALFAGTGRERPAVYRHLEKLVTVAAGSRRPTYCGSWVWIRTTAECRTVARLNILRRQVALNPTIK